MPDTTIDIEPTSSWIKSTVIAAGVDTIGVLPLFMTGALALQLRAAIGLEVGTIGLLFAGYFGAAALLSTPAGAVSERMGPAITLRVGVTIYALVFVGSATANSVVMLALYLVLAGVGTSMTRTASSLLVARSVPDQRQGLAFGLRNSAIPAAALLSGLAVPAIALTIGWRWAYLGAAVLAVILLTVLPSDIQKPTPRDSGDRSDLPTPMLVSLAFVAGLASLAAVPLAAYTVVTAVSAGFSEAAAGLLVAVGSILGLSSRIVIGSVADRRGGSQFDLVTWLIGAGAIAYTLISTSNASILWAAVPLAYATGWAFHGAFFVSIIRLNPEATGVAVGITQAGAFGGSIIGPAALGSIASHYSFRVAWLAAATAALSAGAMLYALNRRIRARYGG